MPSLSGRVDWRTIVAPLCGDLAAGIAVALHQHPDTVGITIVDDMLVVDVTDPVFDAVEVERVVRAELLEVAAWGATINVAITSA